MGIFTQTHEGLNFISTEANIQYDGSDIVTFLSSGNVGIGTTSPSRKLHVIGGDVYVPTTSDTAGTGSYGGNSFELRNSATGEHFNVDVFNRTTATWYTPFHIQNTGNVGIGTTSPTEELHVEGEVKIQPKHTTGTPPSLYLGDLNNQYQSGISSTGHLTFRSTSSTYFQTGGANYRMMIDNSGNVGIGTISPATLLHVSSANPEIRITDTSNTNYNSIRNVDGNFWIEADKGNQLGNSRIRFTVDNAEAMTVDTGGNVGIGTTSPADKLQVDGNIQVASTAPIIKLNDTNATNTANQRGYVSFQINGTESGWMGYGSGGNNYLTLKNNSGFTVLDGTSGILFSNSNTERMRITSTGNVGIGTTNPSQKLHVVGGQVRLDSNAGGFYQYNTSGGFRSAFYDNGTVTSIYGDGDGSNPAITINSGNVGIGTTSPSYKLDVDGEARVTNGIHNNTYVEHVTNDLPGASNANTNRHQYQFMELAYNTFHWSNGSPIIIEVMQTDFTGSEYAKYMLNWNYLDGGGTNEFILKVLENTSVNGNSNNHRVIIGTPYDTGVNDGGYDLYALPLLLEAWYYCDYVVKVSFANVGMTRISTGTNFSVRAQYKFWDAPSATVIAGTPSSTEILPSPNNHAFYGTLYGDGRLFNQSTSNSIGNITNYFVDPANTITAAHLAGSVGIGTTSPAEKLDINGDMVVRGRIYFDGTASSYIDNISNELTLRSSNSFKVSTYSGGWETRMTVADDGNVGIGTTSPSSNLHVNGAGGSGVVTQIKVTQADDGSGHPGADAILQSSGWGEAFLKLAGHQVSAAGGDMNIVSSSDLKIQTGGTNTRMFVTSTGNVGIGTTSPNNKLDVRRANSGIVAEFNSTAGTPDEYADIKLISGNTTTGTYGTILRHQRVGSSGADFAILTNPTLTGTPVERLRITKDGNVGIGTTSPSTKLDVVGASGADTYGRFLGGAGGTKGGIILGNNDVGKNYGRLYFDNSNNNVYLYQEYPTGNLILGTNTTEQMRITSAGNVGIGTTSPSTALDVVGTITAYRYQAISSSASLVGYGVGTGLGMFNAGTDTLGFATASTERMRITSAGNVGIGTTSPSYKLDVSGTARAVKSKIDITPTSDTIALDIRGTGTPNDYFTVSNATGGANDVFLPIFFYKAATYGYNGGTNRYPSGVYGGGFVAAVDDTSYPSAAGAGAAMHFNARTYANNGPLTNRYLFSWGSWLTTHMAMTAGGNLLIGKTSDNGEKLQVNGNADVSGNVNADGDFYQNGVQGWSGTINIPTNPPVTITVQGGIITNVT